MTSPDRAYDRAGLAGRPHVSTVYDMRRSHIGFRLRPYGPTGGGRRTAGSERPSAPRPATGGPVNGRPTGRPEGSPRRVRSRSPGRLGVGAAAVGSWLPFSLQARYQRRAHRRQINRPTPGPLCWDGLTGAAQHLERVIIGHHGLVVLAVLGRPAP